MENDLAKLVEMYDEAEHVTYDARQESQRARDYWDGKQLTHAEVEELKKRKQPPIVINRVRRKIQWLRGIEIKQRTDPKAFPRNPSVDDAAAEACTHALRYVADNTDWDRKRSMVWGDMLVEGFGGVEVTHKVKKSSLRNGTALTPPDVDVVVNRYPWDRLFYDPYSVEHDFTDARYMGAVVWQDAEALKEEYPGKRAVIDQFETEHGQSWSDTYDDKPREYSWYDGTRKRIKVVLMWYRKGGEWHWCKFVRSDKLDSGTSPYQNEDGESVCPLIMQSMYVGRENNERYGIVRDMFHPQDEVNKRRSKSLHLINVRQARISPSVTDKAQVQRELAKPDGIVEAEAEDFDILPTGDLAAGQFELLQEAKNEIDLMGANSALEGEAGSSTSGRALLARQQGGMVEIAPEMDELHAFTRRVYEAMWDRIRQFWTAEKWIRVTDDEKKVRFVGFNRPVTFGEELGQRPPEEIQMIATQMALTPNDPRLFQVVRVENNVADIDVDIIIEEVPDRVTLQGEMFEALAKYGPQLPPEVLIEADPVLPQDRKERLISALEEARQREAEMAGPRMEMELAQGQADIAKTQAEAAKAASEAQGLPLAAVV